MDIRFGAFFLDPESYVLSKGGEPVSLDPLAFSLLQFLVENRDRVIGKDELIEHVWGGRIVSDSAITSAINTVRRAVEDDGKTQGVIKTFPRKGFRFVAEIAQDQGKEQDTAAASKAEPVSISDKPSIAVLPFDNLSGDPEQDFFSDGITEDIITALSRIRQFFVIARNTTFTYKGRAVGIQEIAGELGVRYILEGSVRKDGEHVRITAQLIDGKSGNHLWAEKYDRQLDDIFAVQDEITMMVAGSIEPELGKAEGARASNQKPENLDAWELYHRGMAHSYRRSKGDFAKAQECFSRAINIDPNFASAYSGSAVVHLNSIAFGYSEAPAEDRKAAMEKAQKGVDLDPDDPAAHAMLGIVSQVERPEIAIRAFERSLELNLSSALAHSGLGFVLADIGRFDEAMRHHDEAVRLGRRDPTLPIILARRSASHHWAGEYEEALEWMNQAVNQANAQAWQYYAQMAATLVKLDRLDEARNAVGRVREINPGITLKTVRDFAFSQSENLDHFVDNLRKAGLQED